MKRPVSAMAMAHSEEIIPDSEPTTVDCSTPRSLGNLFSVAGEEYRSQSPVKDECAKPPSCADSQETHISSESLPISNQNWELPQTCYNTINTTSNPDQSFAPAAEQSQQPEANISEQSRAKENKRALNINSQPEAAAEPAQKLPKLNNTPELPVGANASTDAGYTDATMKLLVDIGEAISDIGKLLASATKADLDKAGKKKDAAYKQIGRVAEANKTEKAELLRLKANGDLDKDRLQRLAKRQRSLVSTMRSLKEITEKLTDAKRIATKSRETQDFDLSQSILATNSTTNTELRSPQPTFLPPSILKTSTQASERERKNSLATEVTTASQKKVVKFHIPFKGNEIEPPSTDNKATRPSTPDEGVDISDIFGPATRISDQNFADTSKDASRRLEKDENQRKTPPMEFSQSSDSTQLVNILQVPNQKDNERADSQRVVPASDRIAASLSNKAPPMSVDIDTQSIGSCSLMSGISSVDFSLLGVKNPHQRNMATGTSNHTSAVASRPIITGISPQTIPSQTAARPLPIANIMQWTNSQNIAKPASQPSNVNVASQETLPDLAEMIRRGMIVPGKGVLSHQGKVQIYTASLLGNGYIQGTGGETFQSPMTWLKALSGYRPLRTKAYKMISSKGKTLYDICTDPPKVPPRRETQMVFRIVHQAALPIRPIVTVASPAGLGNPFRAITQKTDDATPEVKGDDNRVREDIVPKYALLVQDDELFEADSLTPGLWEESFVLDSLARSCIENFFENTETY